MLRSSKHLLPLTEDRTTGHHVCQVIGDSGELPSLLLLPGVWALQVLRSRDEALVLALTLMESVHLYVRVTTMECDQFLDHSIIKLENQVLSPLLRSLHDSRRIQLVQRVVQLLVCTIVIRPEIETEVLQNLFQLRSRDQSIESV